MVGNEITNTIFNQLGGGRAVAMTGAKEFVYGERSLRFKMGAGAKGSANICRITLASDDTYTIETFKFRKLEMITVGERMGVYADDLRRVFTNLTGFHVSLWR